MQSRNSISNTFILNRYSLLKTIGHGSFSKVKLANDILTQKHVAIKIMPKSNMSEREFSTLTKIIKSQALNSCPNLVKIHGIHTIVRDPHSAKKREFIYTVMEYLPDGDLFDYILNEKSLSSDEARSIFQQLICGLYVLYDQNFSHRDLKPENILIKIDPETQRVTVKIADYGFSKRFNDGDLFKTSLGSPNYAAPEVIRGKLYDPQQADVWSCGIILYAMVYGYLPFEGNSDNLTRLYQKIELGNFITKNSIPATINELIREMICVNPLKRPSFLKISQHPWFQENIPNEVKTFFPIFADKDNIIIPRLTNVALNSTSKTTKNEISEGQTTTHESGVLIMNKLYNLLIQHNYIWKNITNYSLKIKLLDASVKGIINLYKDNSGYAIDLQLISGTPMEFFEIGKVIYKAGRTSPGLFSMPRINSITSWDAHPERDLLLRPA